MINHLGEMMLLLIIMIMMTMMMDTYGFPCVFFYAASGKVRVLNEGGSKFFVA